MKPADLQPGHRIPTPGLGTLTVTKEPWFDGGPESAARLGYNYQPEDDRVEVDVELDYVKPFGDPDILAAEVGAWAAQFLSLQPLRYRLFFLPDTDVEVEP